MNIGEVLDLLHNVQDRVGVRLFFTQKRGQNTYGSYSPILDSGLAEKLITIIADNLERQKDLPICDFSPVGAYSDTLERYDTADLMNFEAVMDSYMDNAVERDRITPDTIKRLSFYCFSVDWIIDTIPVNIKFFRRITKFRKLSSKGILGYIHGNTFSSIEAEVMGMDGDIDLIVKENDMLILNHVALERIFSMADQYVRKANEAIQKVGEANRIINFDVFAEDCLDDKRVTRILTKLLNEEDRLEHCFENFENVKKAIDIFEVDIRIESVNGEEQLIYESKRQLMDMVRLIRDSYYKSIIQERHGVDDSL